MALNRQATIGVLQIMRVATTAEIYRLLSDAMVNGHATSVPTNPSQMSGTLVTVHHAGSEHYTVEIH